MLCRDVESGPGYEVRGWAYRSRLLVLVDFGRVKSATLLTNAVFIAHVTDFVAELFQVDNADGRRGKVLDLDPEV